MKIIIEDIGPDEEEAVIIRCREVDESILQLVIEAEEGKTGGQTGRENFTDRAGRCLLF